MEDSNGWHIPWALFVSDLIGTALLVPVGPCDESNHVAELPGHRAEPGTPRLAGP